MYYFSQFVLSAYMSKELGFEFPFSGKATAGDSDSKYSCYHTQNNK